MKLQRFAYIFALIFSFTIFAAAQTTKPTPTPQQTDDDGGDINFKSRLVVVPVSVLDASGQPVLGLKAQDFRILEENKQQEIAQISDAEKVPLEIALLFDISASTDPMFQFEQETAAQFLKDVMRPEDRATIFTIGEQPLLIKARDTSNNASVAVKSEVPTKQFTAFYDTVRAAADYLQKNAPRGSRKIILVISDGEDTNSQGVRNGFSSVYASLGKKLNTISSEELRKLISAKRDEIRSSEQSKVLRALQNADTVFYAINPAGSSYQLNKISVFGQSNLQKFADETGGSAFLPKFQPIDTKDNLQNGQNTRNNSATLRTIFQQLANELQAQYLVQYYSEADFPVNRYVKLNVNLANPQKYKLRARQGYFVKE